MAETKLCYCCATAAFGLCYSSIGQSTVVMITVPLLPCRSTVTAAAKSVFAREKNRLALGENTTFSRLSIVRFDTGSKRSIGRLLGGEKNNFLIRGAEVVSRAGGMLSIRGPQVPLGSPRVGTRRAQSSTLYMRVMPPPHTNEQVLGQTSGSSPNPSTIGSTALWGAPSARACRVGLHPPSDLPHSESESLPASPKSVLFGLDSTRERQIR